VGFWIYMLTMELLVPAIMIAFGSWSVHHAPKEINALFGYRTAMSMKNRDTWEFAHHHNGRIWRAAGWVLLAVSAPAMLLVRGKSADSVGAFGTVLVGVQVVVLVLSILPTEAALRKTFDSNGNRR